MPRLTKVSKICPTCGTTFAKRPTSKYCSPTCAGVSPKIEYDYHLLAFQKAYSWVGILPKETHNNTKWQCSKGHEWEASYHSVKHGNGCIYCSGHYKRTIKDYELLASERNFTWLGQLPEKTAYVTLWRCNACNHEWKASHNNMTSKKSGCPNCAGQVRVTLAQYHTLAELKGVKLIGDMPKNANSLATWECSKGHTFTRAYTNLKGRESSCPLCGDFVNGKLVSKPQRELHKLIGGILNYRMGNYAIDVAFVTEKIAVEYDCWYWHDPVKDAIKDVMLFKKGWKIIRIKAGIMLPTLERFSEALASVKSGESLISIVLSDFITLA